MDRRAAAALRREARSRADAAEWDLWAWACQGRRLLDALAGVPGDDMPGRFRAEALLRLALAHAADAVRAAGERGGREG